MLGVREKYVGIIMAWLGKEIYLVYAENRWVMEEFLNTAFFLYCVTLSSIVYITQEGKKCHCVAAVYSATLFISST